ncbi:MAG: hypothetical protein L6Q83_03565 [Gammaproteobacteria bacterium]|nr:hypothetical protein [Gammaproteobacteria bacterium]
MTSAELATPGARGLHHRRTATAGEPGHEDGSRRPPEPVREYLNAIVADLAATELRCEPVAAARLPELIFGLQTGREFCYLSRARVAPYREAACAQIARDIARGEPVHYCLDIGGGYHASLRPGTDALCFAPGLGELLLLRQISRFDAGVRRLYPPGTRFSLVIDNLVAWFVNDIPTERTGAYCAKLRELIAQLALAPGIELWVESEHLTTSEFERRRGAFHAAPCADDLSCKDHDTVARFLGRACGSDEVAERTARYRAITGVSSELIGSRLDGLRMTQRATPETICFRPFPGADSRIQSGEVALRVTGGKPVVPMLLTSHNQHLYDWYRVGFPDMLPPAIGPVICAEPASRSTA